MKLERTLTLDVPLVQALQMLGFRNQGTEIAALSDEIVKRVGPDVVFPITITAADVLAKGSCALRGLQDDKTVDMLNDLVLLIRKDEPQRKVEGVMGLRVAK